MKRIFKEFGTTQGNVVIEFTLTSVAMFIPISYIAVAATNVASGYIQVQDAARTAARVMATSQNDSIGKSRARETVLDLTDQSSKVTVIISCSHNPCLVDEEIVTVEVRKEIALNVPVLTSLGSVTVTGIQAEVVQEI